MSFGGREKSINRKFGETLAQEHRSQEIPRSTDSTVYHRIVHDRRFKPLKRIILFLDQ